MQRAEGAALPPGECKTCGRGEGPFVDTLREDLTGRIYVCHLCVSGMAKLLDSGRDERALADRYKREAISERRAKETVLAELEELRRATILTLRQGAVSRNGVIVLRQRATA